MSEGQQPGEEDRAFVEAVQRFAAGRLAPQAAVWDESETFPVATLREAGELGLCGLFVPDDQGGLGISRELGVLLFEALAEGCTSFAAFLSIHNMATAMVARFGSAAMRAQHLPGLISGERLASYCLTEPEAGSDAATLRTRASRQEDGYVLDGAKAFISGAGDTQWLVVMARTAATGAKGISAFLVPADHPGISYGRRERKLGWRSQATRMVLFEGVFIPESHRLGGEGQGFAMALQALDGGRLNIAACSVGTARAALKEALAYVKTRRQFGQAINQFQAVQFRLADMATELQAARALLHQAARHYDAGHRAARVFCAMAKRFCTDAAFAVADAALELHGGYGVLGDYPVERHLRDLRLHRLLEGTNDIMRLITARQLLDDDALEGLL